jgi:hypothetical protein
MSRLRRTLTALTLAAALAGCEILGPVDPLSEGCDHLTALPTSVSAAAVASGAPELATHTHYLVSLPEGSGGRAGTVKFSSTLRGRLLVLLGADLPVRVSNSMSATVASTDSGSSGPCEELRAWSAYQVGVGTQTITLGGAGTTQAMVDLVLETEADEP